MDRMRADDLLETARRALTLAAWAEARSAFSAALECAESPEAYEGLGIAARYELDGEAAIAAHEAGYRLARGRSEDEWAARLAIQLAYDAYVFRGPAEAAGWAERARMLVEGKPPSVASAYVSYLKGYLALLADHDPVAALEAATEASTLARKAGAVDVEMLAAALQGLALVASGRVSDGLRKLDAATAAAVGGEMDDADSIETVCCLMIDACKRVRDIERAHEWCVRVRELATRFNDRQMFSVCRTHYADVLLWEGAWQDAERELTAAVDELARLRPGREEEAIVRLAELRRRQGQAREASELLQRVRVHRLQALVSGLLALDRGDHERALDDAHRFLRRVGPDGFERVAGLDLVLRASIAAGDDDGAAGVAAEIASVAALAPNAGLLASSLLAEGRLQAARGELREAQIALEEAAARFDAVGAPYEAALAQLEAAEAAQAAGRADRASESRRAAREALRSLGAALPMERNELLSPRETEVLRLVARGLSNEDIAHTLVLSVRTVERHVANLYRKIGASGRTARATATAWAHRHGIT
jgi:ATP/maltotriose-dependent transcriptional regulator MalT